VNSPEHFNIFAYKVSHSVGSITGSFVNEIKPLNDIMAEMAKDAEAELQRLEQVRSNAIK